ncbi:acyl-CoA dehydrogenase family protein [Aeromicrobium alkaliterrae]|uniref:Acyl-CoA dehydrogenase n=1 Tax=Aeromicrobium alkaliterrae TaxID=302168 RepID=A0ABN2KF53_9ACTN
MHIQEVPTESSTDNHVEVARNLIPLLQNGAEETERGRRLAPEVSEAMRASGLLQVCAPLRAGGSGGNFRDLIEVSAELARGDGSAGWVAFIANAAAFATSAFADEVRAEIFADPLNVVVGQYGPNGVATRVDGGYRVTGKWRFASGCYQAQWTLNGVRIADDNGEVVARAWALLPLAELELEDSWHVAGMSGTGSNTLIANDVFVRDGFMVDHDTFAGRRFAAWHDDEPQYRSSMRTVAQLGIVGPLMGLAEAAWENILAMMNEGRPIIQTSYKDIRESPSYRLALGEARNAIDQGSFHVFRAADRVDSAALDGRHLDLGDHARIWGDASAATKKFRDAVDLLLDIGGTRSFSVANPLQRIWRDLEIGSRHGLNNRLVNAERHALGLLDLDRPPLIDG